MEKIRQEAFYMGSLCCDICGSTLTMQADGTGAVCQACGMRYGLDRLQAKAGQQQTPKPAPSGRKSQNQQEEDVAGYYILVKQYYNIITPETSGPRRFL